MDNRILSVNQVAETLGLAPLTVRRLMDLYSATGGKAGLPWIQLPGAVCRKVRGQALTRYLDSLEAAAANA